MTRVPIYALLFLPLAFQLGCKEKRYCYTEDESSKTVKLRNELISLASGKTKEMTGSTQPSEGYVLMYGYMSTESLYQLPIPSTLHSKLEDIRPTPDYEIYVLAHFQGTDILEHTRWVNDGNHFPSHPILNVPLVIRGNPYKGRLKEEFGEVEISN